MSIAFSTILIFLFLLPGLAFRRFYFTGEFSKEYFRSSGFEIFFLGIVPSIVFHTIGYNIIPFATPFSIDLWFFEWQVPELRIDIEMIGMLLVGKGDHEYILAAFKTIGSHYNHIVFYNLGITITGALSGYLAKTIVRNLKLDRRIKILRFQNEWHYILTSEILDFPKVKRKSSYNKKGMRLSAD